MESELGCSAYSTMTNKYLMPLPPSGHASSSTGSCTFYYMQSQAETSLDSAETFNPLLHYRSIDSSSSSYYTPLETDHTSSNISSQILNHSHRSDHFPLEPVEFINEPSDFVHEPSEFIQCSPDASEDYFDYRFARPNQHPNRLLPTYSDYNVSTLQPISYKWPEQSAPRWSHQESLGDPAFSCITGPSTNSYNSNTFYYPSQPHFNTYVPATHHTNPCHGNLYPTPSPPQTHSSQYQANHVSVNVSMNMRMDVKSLRPNAPSSRLENAARILRPLGDHVVSSVVSNVMQQQGSANAYRIEMPSENDCTPCKRTTWDYAERKSFERSCPVLNQHSSYTYAPPLNPISSSIPEVAEENRRGKLKSEVSQSCSIDVRQANVCMLCGKSYARPSTLKTHLRTHSGEKPYRCSVCMKSFSQAANLTAHMRTHSGEKPFQCMICYRKFSQSSSVTTHMRTHSGERPYRCMMCRKAFSDSSTLTKHLRIHSGEKPYQCRLCSLRFSQSGNLNRHMRIHLSM